MYILKFQMQFRDWYPDIPDEIAILIITGTTKSHGWHINIVLGISPSFNRDPGWHLAPLGHNELTHWGRVTHIGVSILTIIGSDYGLLPERHQAIIWTNAGILLIRTLGTNFSEIISKIHTFSFKKMHLKTLSAKWQPFCLSLNVLMLHDFLMYGGHHMCCFWKWIETKSLNLELPSARINKECTS